MTIIDVPNPEVLRAGMRHIEEHIRLWDQNEFIQLWDKNGDALDFAGTDGPPCGTSSCLAGHILLAQGMTWKEIVKADISETALKALGFEGGERGDGEDFFDVIFCYTHDDSGLLANTPEKLELFKAYVTRQTGVEFE